jgi:methyl-accepting chemotaxis protein
MVTEIQAAVVHAVAAITAGHREVDEGMQVIQRTVAALKTISEVVGQTDSGIGHIAKVMGGLNSGVDRLVASLTKVAAIAEDSAAGVGEVSMMVQTQIASIQAASEAAESLFAVSSELEDLVMPFTTSESKYLNLCAT